jgi:hypothetical protein
VRSSRSLAAIVVALTAGACGSARQRTIEPDPFDAGSDAGLTQPQLRIAGAEALGRVAAVLWMLPLDDGLVQRAATFRTRADAEATVREMLADPRATVGVGRFFRWWLALDAVPSFTRDPTLYPEATPQLFVDMATETTTFGVETTRAPGATFETLLTASWSYVNARLADVYGIAGVTGDSFRRVDLPAGRAGMLTQPALQALGSIQSRPWPSQRGYEIWQELFCRDTPSGPAGIPGPDMAAPPPGTTMRQTIAAAVASDPACKLCHDFMDPPGLAFEGFDAIGRARSLDNGAPVDTSNLRIILDWGVGNDVLTVNGPVELAHAIASNVEAQDCLARKWLSFALGRDLADADQPSLKQIEAAYHAAGHDLQTLVVAVLTSDTFLAPP